MVKTAFSPKFGKLLVIIPARGGSKRLPGKNIKNFCGKPLIAWTIETAKNSKYVDRVIVSTDDKKIAATAKKYGAEVPFIRPKDLATDTALTVDVIMHAISYMNDKEKYEPDFICLLQPTSPIRNAVDLDKACELLIEKNAVACVSVTPTKINPYFTSTIDSRGFYHDYFKPGGRRYASTLKPQKTYLLNGAIYIIKKEVFFKEKIFEPKNTVSYVMDEYSSVDIDTLDDFEMAAFLMKKRLNL